jgi:hypothetical protein
MVVCGSYMFELGTSKDMKYSLRKGGDGNREDNATLMSNTNYEWIEIQC